MSRRRRCCRRSCWICLRITPRRRCRRRSCSKRLPPPLHTHWLPDRQVLGALCRRYPLSRLVVLAHRYLPSVPARLACPRFPDRLSVLVARSRHYRPLTLVGLVFLVHPCLLSTRRGPSQSRQ